MESNICWIEKHYMFLNHGDGFQIFNKSIEGKAKSNENWHLQECKKCSVAASIASIFTFKTNKSFDR